MNTNHLEKLEYNKILEQLNKFCTTQYGKNLANKLLPNNEKTKVISLLQETLEAINLSTRNSFPSFYDAGNIEITLKQLESMQSLNTKKYIKKCRRIKNIFW